MSDVSGLRKEKVDAIINKTCQYYGITPEELKSTNKGRNGVIWKWKRFVVYFIYTHTDLYLSEIQDLLGYKSQSSMHNVYSSLKDQLSEGLYGDAKVKLNYNELLTHLEL